MDQGTKHDEGKVRFDLLPQEALEGAARVLMFGATKYDENNWRKGIQYRRVWNGIQRHLWAWLRREDLDLESGINHLHHAACGVMFLQTFIATGRRALDDRKQKKVKKLAGKKKAWKI